MDLKYIHDNLSYDLEVNGYVYHGNIDYITDHIADGPVNVTPVQRISKSQTKDLQDFVNKYFEALKTNPNLTIEQFYNQM